MFADLIATEGVEEIYRSGLPIGLMAVHGGLEEGTEAIAMAVSAATGAALYAVVQPDTLWWHVPSIRFDPAESEPLATFLDSVETAVSVHGYGEPGLEGTALLGGTNRDLAMAIHGELAARGVEAISDLDAIPRRLRGLHRNNPVNRPPSGGVQIELPMSLRRGRAFGRVVEALAATVGKATTDISAPDSEH